MSLTFGEKIRDARKSQNLTQKQLAEIIGAKHNSVSDWENDKNKPDPDTIELLCGVLKITPNYLLKSSNEEFSPKEKQIIKNYRELDPHGKSHVDSVLDWETARVKSLLEKDNRIAELEATAGSNYDKLNDIGKHVATERVKELTEVPRYVKEDTTYVKAAHAIEGALEEDKEHDEDIMKNF